LVSVTVSALLEVPTACLPNERVAGNAVACNSPVPVRETVCGLLLALSVMVRVPGLEPVAVGVKVTLMVQLDAAATEVPHVLV
jgi:hypothetical protein